MDRNGIVLLGGIELSNDTTYPRLDAIVPVRLEGAPQFRLGASVSYTHQSAVIPGSIAIDAYALSLGPNAYYDWRLPIASNAGDFVISVEGGIVAVTAWLKVDQPYMPGTYDRLTAYGVRMASAFQFRGRNGLVVSVQPVGVDVPVSTPSLPNNSNGLTVTSKTEWEGALLCGYQFR